MPDWPFTSAQPCCSPELLFEVIEEIDALDQLWLVGRESRWRHIIEKTLVGCWTCGAFYLLHTLMRDLEIAHLQIVKQERLAALGQMASGVAHDLNNALTPVVTMSSLLQEQKVSPEQREMLTMIQSGAEHASGVVRQLQDFYRPDSAAADEYTPVDLSELVDSSMRLAHFAWWTKPCDVESETRSRSQQARTHTYWAAGRN